MNSISVVTARQDHKNSRLPNVLIADDTDLPKSDMFKRLEI